MSLTVQQQQAAEAHIQAIVEALRDNNATELTTALGNTYTFFQSLDRISHEHIAIQKHMRNSQPELASYFSNYAAMSAEVLGVLLSHKQMLNLILGSLTPSSHPSDAATQKQHRETASFCERWEAMLNIKKLTTAITDYNIEHIQAIKTTFDKLYHNHRQNHVKAFFLHEFNALCESVRHTSSCKIMLALAEFYKNNVSQREQYYNLIAIAAEKDASHVKNKLIQVVPKEFNRYKVNHDNLFYTLRVLINLNLTEEEVFWCTYITKQLALTYHLQNNRQCVKTTKPQIENLVSQFTAKITALLDNKDNDKPGHLNVLAAYAEKYGFLQQQFDFLQAAAAKLDNVALTQLVSYTYASNDYSSKRPITLSKYRTPQQTSDNVYQALIALNNLHPALLSKKKLTHFAYLAKDFEAIFLMILGNRSAIPSMISLPLAR